MAAYIPTYYHTMHTSLCTVFTDMYSTVHTGYSPATQEKINFRPWQYNTIINNACFISFILATSWLLPRCAPRAVTVSKHEISPSSFLFRHSVLYHRSIAIATPIQSRHALPTDIAPRIRDRPPHAKSCRLRRIASHRITLHGLSPSTAWDAVGA